MRLPQLQLTPVVVSDSNDLGPILGPLAEAAQQVQDRAYRVRRRLSYFRRVAQIFTDMKLCELRTTFVQTQSERDKEWEIVHNRNADRVLAIALELGGFYVKAGQLLSTRADFVPHAWIEKLSRLQDDAPCMSGELARDIVERELALACDIDFERSRRDGRQPARWCRIYGEGAPRIPVEAVFEDVDWQKPVGSASLAQVHAGYLARDVAGTKRRRKVAVKVQNPVARRLVLGDVDSLMTVAKIVEKTDLKVNFVPFLEEVRRGVRNELDFVNEAYVMNSIADQLAPMKKVHVPRPLPRLCTRRLLVMDFLQGKNLMALRKERLSSSENDVTPTWQKRIFGRQLLSMLGEAYGHMLFGQGLFHGDPHPGNLLAMKRPRVRGPLGMILPKNIELGLIDFGQSKQLTVQAQQQLSRLVLELSSQTPSAPRISAAVRATGMQFENMGAERNAYIARIARLLFSTEAIPGTKFQPFGKDSILAGNGITDVPESFVFVIRSVQMMRGIAAALDVEDFSLANKLRRFALNFETQLR